MRPIQLPGLILLLSYCVTAVANIEVDFVESAPKDWFEVKNTGNCELADLIMEIDLSQSAGKLIFDTTGRGAGVEVFQPFEVRSGNLALHATSRVQDGERSLAISIPKLGPDSSVSFTIDVDDTLKNSELGQIRVSGSEIQGGVIKLLTQNPPDNTSAFNKKGKAVLEIETCP